MINRIRNIIKKIYIKRLMKRGLTIARNVSIEKGVNIDANFPWLIKIGNNVILSAWVYILAHDAAGKNHIGLTKIGKVVIEDNVFIGAKSTILPGVTIGQGSIIGTNSVVTKDIPPFSVAVGIPARVISDIEQYTRKSAEDIKRAKIYGRLYTIWGGITKGLKRKMIIEMGENVAYIDTDKEKSTEKPIL